MNKLVSSTARTEMIKSCSIVLGVFSENRRIRQKVFTSTGNELAMYTYQASCLFTEVNQRNKSYSLWSHTEAWFDYFVCLFVCLFVFKHIKEFDEGIRKACPDTKYVIHKESIM